MLASHPHSVTDPPPNLTIGSKFFFRDAKRLWLWPNNSLRFLWPQHFIPEWFWCGFGFGLVCPDEPLPTSSDSVCGEYAEKAFYALPFHWAVLVQSALDCGTMYNDTISSKMFLELFRGDLWFECDYSNYSLSLIFRYFSWPTTSFLHKDCSCGVLFSNYISDCGDKHLKPFW